MNSRLDSVEDCLSFFKKAYPVSEPKNFRTQFGVFLEEIGETLKTISTDQIHEKDLLNYLENAITQAGNHFKNSDGQLSITNRVELLDGICDVMVTAVGLGYHAKMNVSGGFNEVNRSNNSKFDEMGQPIFDKNKKVTKGPFYSKPNLKIYV